MCRQQQVPPPPPSDASASASCPSCGASLLPPTLRLRGAHLLLLEALAAAQHLDVQVVHRRLHARARGLGHTLQVLVRHAAGAEDAAVGKVLGAQVACRVGACKR